MNRSAMASAIQSSRTLERWMLLTTLLSFLLCAPIKSLGQGGDPPHANHHRNRADSMIPSPGIIGVALHLTAKRIGDPAGLFIRATHPLGPAVKAGIMHGQEILSVDGQSIKGKTYQEVVAMIRGEVGQAVTLRVKTLSDVKDVHMIRVSEQRLVEDKQT